MTCKVYICHVNTENLPCKVICLSRKHSNMTCKAYNCHVNTQICRVKMVNWQINIFVA